ncbi:polyprenyl synthetase family protein [Psychrobacter sp.]|uniref:polyprenyl synthetase family protein n=1 Tax=Psychrobacter sp. TaxID=56811 RepID=UPI0025EBE4E6|nr:farnesyl diphosphate synthase [Psychrobacter sp.]
MKQPINFEKLSQQVITTLEADIDSLLNHANLPNPLNEACHYAMMGQGKRVRPLLVACGYQTVMQNKAMTTSGLTIAFEISSELPVNCRRAMLAVELLHTYSLIHDDLPCMDDDDLRRGRPTCHIKFDEATAMLTGDVLQTLAFEILTANIDGFEAIPDDQVAKLLKVFAPRARKMVSGQMLDLNAENRQIDQDHLETIHRDKTGALIEAAVLMGGVCAEASAEQSQSLMHFAKNIGLAFQVQDDILDVTASTDTLGKPAGSDEGLNKSTYVKLMGVEKATDYAQSLFVDAKQAVDSCFSEKSVLNALADWLWQRQK